MPRTAAVLFDVDFTLIHPGPRFQGVGYASSCAAHGIDVDEARFEAAVAGASGLLDSPHQLYDAGLFVRYTSRIIELMGGAGPDVEIVARAIYDDWAEHRHFELYDDVSGALTALKALGFKLGLVSNSHRPLDSFGAHFALDGLISATVSSSDHGFLKPHPSIFQAALDLMQVSPEDAVMVGDSFAHDIVGAHQAGMRGILLARREMAERPPVDVPVIRSLAELPALLRDAE
ncbi:MAG TPA: HAD family hydrolase [Vicinamibacterales bacterium]|nr:HAD family hydrolase [Vicinamibacterales bacterium]